MIPGGQKEVRTRRTDEIKQTGNRAIHPTRAYYRVIINCSQDLRRDPTIRPRDYLLVTFNYICKRRSVIFHVVVVRG